MSKVTEVRAKGRKPTTEEAEAILTLVRGGWLKLELTVVDDCPVCDSALSPAAAVMSGQRHNHD